VINHDAYKQPNARAPRAKHNTPVLCVMFGCIEGLRAKALCSIIQHCPAW